MPANSQMKILFPNDYFIVTFALIQSQWGLDWLGQSIQYKKCFYSKKLASRPQHFVLDTAKYTKKRSQKAFEARS